MLSTLHTNDAATSFPRLMDMGVESFMVASTIQVVVAQRLVRKICTRCKVSLDVSYKVVKGVRQLELKNVENVDLSMLEASVRQISETLMKKVFGTKKKMRLYVGKGCDVCHQTGYSGRVGVFEVMLVDDEIRELITNREDSVVIHKKAMENGMTSLFEDGLAKVQQGVTTFAEVLRVTRE